MLTQGVDSKIQLTEKHSESNSLSNFNAYFLSKCSIHYSIKITLANSNQLNAAAHTTTSCTCSAMFSFATWRDIFS